MAKTNNFEDDVNASENLEHEVDDSHAYEEASDYKECDDCGAVLDENGLCVNCDDIEWGDEDDEDFDDDLCEECGELLDANGLCWQCDEDFEELPPEFDDEADESYD